MTKRTVETNPVKVIRQKCLYCTCGQIKEIELCPSVDCPLWPWRKGINPYRKPPSPRARKAGAGNLKNFKSILSETKETFSQKSKKARQR